jgi:hypothetical protein
MRHHPLPRWIKPYPLGNQPTAQQWEEREDRNQPWGALECQTSAPPRIDAEAQLELFPGQDLGRRR